jgi:hypothetical protein
MGSAQLINDKRNAYIRTGLTNIIDLTGKKWGKVNKKEKIETIEYIIQDDLLKSNFLLNRLVSDFGGLLWQTIYKPG